MRLNTFSNPRTDGFALLITLIVVSVVVSIGLTLLDLTIKQLQLASGSKDSEVSFHAANAGLECARFWRNNTDNNAVIDQRDDMIKFETGAVVSVSCFNQTAVNVTPRALSSGISEYTFRFNGGLANDRCSVVQMITLSSDPDATADANGNAVVLNNANTIISGYTATTKGCQPGGRCTVISSQGYNKPCVGPTESFPIGTIQREVLLEL